MLVIVFSDSALAYISKTELKAMGLSEFAISAVRKVTESREKTSFPVDHCSLGKQEQQLDSFIR